MNMRNSRNCPKISVAPMMDWTDRHCRFFLRLLAPSARLYTEMVTAAALTHGDAERLLQFDVVEHPVALQLGGSDPKMMADAAKLGAQAGYDEININVGCPSGRVQSGQFGACLMSSPDVVASCFKEMSSVSDVPVTVKTRIGIDDQISYEFLREFVAILHTAGCDTFIVHARVAILQGLSPRENRSVPPLHYDRVYELKREFPDLTIVLNGGIVSTEQVLSHLETVDGVMIGRQAYHQPYFLTELEAVLFDHKDWQAPSRHEVIELMIPYIERQMSAGTELKNMTRHLLGLYAGQPGARAWRRHLSEHTHLPGAGIEVLQEALAKLPKAA
ncbi:MAG: tRNA dihydrouridine(20/20a) synthase DusA [Proteobacteria bacterium]|nr:tRNA dihydrouridine(20/20a) synthase DusA [Pseudomonadota bacterium]